MQSQISGLLGMVGDSLIWDRWKPLVFSLGALIMFWFPRIEIWVGVALGCLLLYNIPLFQIRCGEFAPGIIWASAYWMSWATRLSADCGRIWP